MIIVLIACGKKSKLRRNMVFAQYTVYDEETFLVSYKLSAIARSI